MNPVRFFTRKKSETRLGLALGSGGAKGMAHLGALRAFEEEGISFSAVAGTSIGSIVGALYAYGYSSTDTYELVRALDLGEYARMIILKPGGSGLVLALEKFLGGIQEFSDLRLPFAAVATEIESGQPRAFSEGDLAPALAASSAMPPFFRSVEIGGKRYLDGAFSDSVPADVCRDLGADFVVAVDLASFSAASDPRPLLDRFYPGHGIDPSDARERGRRAADVVIDPNLAGYRATHVGAGDEMYELGYAAAKEAIPSIRGGLSANKRNKK